MLATLFMIVRNMFKNYNIRDLSFVYLTCIKILFNFIKLNCKINYDLYANYDLHTLFTSYIIL